MRRTADWRRTGLTLIVSWILTGGYALAQETGADHGTVDHRGREHRNHIGLFLGATYGELAEPHGTASLADGHGPDAGNKNAFTLGIDYHYRLNRLLGVGAFWDHAFGYFRTTVVAPGLFVRPVEQVLILAAPGVELHEGEKEFVFRLGFYYEFHVDQLSLSPTVAVDFLEGKQVLIYGLTMGFGF